MIEYHKSKLNYKNRWKNCPEYKAWEHMNRNHPNDVCIQWRWYKGSRENQFAFRNFLNVLGPRPKGHVLVRPNKERPFQPDNTIWATHAINSKSRGPYRKFACSRDNELIAELERRGYGVTPQKLRG